MVLKHKGVPQFDMPDDIDPISSRGNHILLFKVRLPDAQNNDSTEMKKILDQMIENEKGN